MSKGRRFRAAREQAGQTTATMEAAELPPPEREIVEHPEREPIRKPVASAFGPLPAYVKTVYRSEEKGFRLMEDFAHQRRLIQFLEKPPQDVIDTLVDAGMRYEPDRQIWHIVANPEAREMTDKLALEIDGKDVRIAQARG